MSTSERNETRTILFEAWRKHLAKELVEPLEAQIIQVMLMHPEYHTFFSHPDKCDDKDFGEQNPFLHIGLHLSLHEQISTNRPAGIHPIYQQLTAQTDSHEVEHRMMDCLAEVLWKAQQTGIFPDEQIYLEKLTELLRN